MIDKCPHGGHGGEVEHDRCGKPVVRWFNMTQHPDGSFRLGLLQGVTGYCRKHALSAERVFREISWEEAQVLEIQES